MIRMAAKPSWLLLIFLALKNIWLVHPCPEYMNVYKGRCLERCPYGVKQVEFTNVCTERCPNNAPYLYNKITCVRFCPSDYVAVYPNRCARRIQILNIPGKGQNDSIINCPDEFCSSSSSKPFCYDLVCRERCPPNTFSDRFNCVHTCSGEFPYQYNSSCHAQCPRGAMVTEDNNCVVDCPSNTFLYGNTCVGICPENSFIHNRICLSACPESDPLTLVFGNIKRCLPTCPIFTMRNGSVCELICPSNAMFLLNRTCVSTCPNFAPFILIKTITLYGIRKPLCVESCPDNTFLNGQTCVTKCDSNQFVLNSTCVSSCPNLYEATRVPYKCVDRCTGDMYLYRNMCSETCPDSRFVSNQTCVSQCPPDMPYKVDGKNCVDKCPDNLNFMYKNNCRSDCPKHTHMLNNTCHDKCPKSYNILNHRNVYQSRYNEQNDASTSNCTRLCPFPLFNDSGICATRCSKNKFAFNRTCYVDCPSSHPLVLSRNASCWSHCPSNMVNAGKSCQFGCPTSSPYVFKGKCSEICPSTHPLHLTLNKGIPIYPFQQTLIYCVEQCHNHSSGSVEYYRFNDSCVKYCPPKTMGLKGFCVTTCSKTYKIMYTRTTESGETTECRQHCPNNMIEFNNTCIDEDTCSKVHSMFVYDGKTCIKECPYGFIQQLGFVQRCYSIPTEVWVTHGVLLIIFGICAVVIVLLISDGFLQKKHKVTNNETDSVEEGDDQERTALLLQDSNETNQGASNGRLTQLDPANENVYNNEFTIDEETEQKVPLEHHGEMKSGSVDESFPGNINSRNTNGQTTNLEYSIDDETAAKTVKHQNENSSIQELEHFQYRDQRAEELLSNTGSFSDIDFLLGNESVGGIVQNDASPSHAYENTTSRSLVDDSTSQMKCFQKDINDECGEDTTPVSSEAIPLHSFPCLPPLNYAFEDLRSSNEREFTKNFLESDTPGKIVHDD